MNNDEDWDWLTLRERKTRIVQKSEPPTKRESDASLMLGIVVVGISGALMVIGIIFVIRILIAWLT